MNHVGFSVGIRDGQSAFGCRNPCLFDGQYLLTPDLFTTNVGVTGPMVEDQFQIVVCCSIGWIHFLSLPKLRLSLIQPPCFKEKLTVLNQSRRVDPVGVSLRHLSNRRLARSTTLLRSQPLFVGFAQLLHLIVPRILFQYSRVLIIRRLQVAGSLCLFRELKPGGHKSIQRLLVLRFNPGGNLLHQVEAVGISLSGFQKGTSLFRSLSISQLPIQLDLQRLTTRPLLSGQVDVGFLSVDLTRASQEQNKTQGC